MSRAEASRRELLTGAGGTLAAVLLAFAAYDDITTDKATSFTVEWLFLALCAVWLGFVTWRLLESDHRWLGSISAVVLAAAVAAGVTVRAGTGPFQIEYLTMIAAMLWFLGLAGTQAGQAWRARPEPQV